MSLRSLVTLLSATALVTVVPVAAPPAHAYGYFSVHTFERGSGAPVPYACYSVEDLGAGGTLASACDDDGDGMVLLETHADECGSCRVHQSLPDLPTGGKTPYLLEPDQDGGWQPYVFVNYLKPQLAIHYEDARTGTPLPGACANLAGPTGGGIFAGCDGDAPNGENGDHDGQRDAVISTPRLPQAGPYTVTTTSRLLPVGYVLPEPSTVQAPPAETGDVVTRTVGMIGDATLQVRAVDQKGKPVRGACYAVKDATLRAGLGRICDGRAGDDDKKANGVVRLGELPWGHRYVADQKSVPKGYRLVRKNKSVATEQGETSVLRFTNRAGGLG